jgi:hexosaminidase
MEEVQSYFTKRVQKIVASKGKKMIGWDEIVEGGLAPNVGVMSWNGAKPGIEASRLGHEVVMTPSTHVYIDLMQGDPAIEPPNYASVRLSKSYEFDPIPEGADPKFIKGGQANLWTEQVYNVRHLQYMLWPRGLAISESLWSPKEKKNWNQFFSRMEKHFSRFDVADIKYAPSVYDPIVTASKNANKEVQIKLGTEAPGLDIYYSFDNSFPDDRYPRYKELIVPPKDAIALKIITYRGKTPVGRMMVIPVEELKSRADKNKNYP